jgi:hypothetical protein
MFVVATLTTVVVLAEVCGGKLDSEDVPDVVVFTTDVVPICVCIVELDCEEDCTTDWLISRLIGSSVSKVIVLPFVSFRFTLVRFTL